MNQPTRVTDSDNSPDLSTEFATLLAEEYSLYAKARIANVNLEDAGLQDKHRFFETQFNQLNDMIDRIQNTFKQ